MCRKLLILGFCLKIGSLCLEANPANGRYSNNGNYRQIPRYYGTGTVYGGDGNNVIPNQQGQSAKEILNQKSGLTTFGIISIIFVIIIFCLAFYYGIICYPLLCGHEKNYRFMDVSSTMTEATSPSIESIEHYPNDQKH